VSIKINGIDALQKKLKQNATMSDVKKIVQTNTAELTQKMQRDSQRVLTGHFEGKKFVKPTGATKRSIVATFTRDGLSGHTGPQTEYAPYLIHGTRYMVKRDFFTPAYNEQKEIFKRDLKELTK